MQQECINCFFIICKLNHLKALFTVVFLLVKLHLIIMQWHCINSILMNDKESKVNFKISTLIAGLHWVRMRHFLASIELQQF